MTEPNFIAGNESLSLLSAVEAMIKRSCIIDFGIIQKVRSSGVVDVSVAVTDTEQNMFIMTCILANTASDSFSVYIEPKEGDRVLVVYPRMYDEKMFSVSSAKKKLIINKNANGYNLMCGIAILLNQYQKNNHKNFVKINDGEITIESAKTKIEVDKNGDVSIDTKGKYTIKNDNTDLLSVLKGLSTTLQSLTTTGSQSAQSISADSIADLVKWENTELKKLLSDS